MITLNRSIDLLKTKISSNIKCYGILGFPLSHSLSSFMHNTAYKKLNINAEYFPFEITNSEFKKYFQLLIDLGISGFNLTIPFKEEVIPLLDEITDEAKTIGSVNSVDILNGKTKGFNTDIIGFSKPLEKYAEILQHEAVVIFGSGGSARTILYALIKNFKFPVITLIARNSEKANILLDEAETWIKGRTTLNFVNLDDHNDAGEYIWESKLLVNCTPIGMKNTNSEFSPKILRFLRPGQVVYDLNYNPAIPQLLMNSKSKGGITIGGIEMLYLQGAEAFKIWTGKEMPGKILDLLRKKLKN